MKFSATLIAAAASLFANGVAAQDHGEEYAQTMGPVAFLWPPDRQWSEDTEDIAPCGSSARPSNRTDFPLTGGKVLLVAQDDAWAVDINIAVKSDPTSVNDFQNWYSTNVTDLLDTAHICYGTPDAPSNIKAGDVATIQLVYNALDGTNNVSHYACADIIFVEDKDFVNSGYSAFCFNTTENESAPDGTPSEVTNSAASAAASSTAGASATTATPGGAASTTTSANSAQTYALSGLLAAAGAIAAML